MRPEEYADVGRLTVAAYEQVAEGDLGDYREVLCDVAGRVASACVLVCESDGELVGTATFVAPGSSFAELGDDESAELRIVAVRPDRQGRGAGRAMVLDCLDRARASGAKRVWLYSTPSMTVAHALYGSMGFIRAASRDWLLSAEEGGPLHLLAFVLELEAAG